MAAVVAAVVVVVVVVAEVVADVVVVVVVEVVVVVVKVVVVVVVSGAVTVVSAGTVVVTGIVVDDRTAGHRNRATNIHAATEADRHVMVNRTVGHDEGIVGIDLHATAVKGRLVVRNSTAVHGKRSGILHKHAAAVIIITRIPYDGATVHDKYARTLHTDAMISTGNISSDKRVIVFRQRIVNRSQSRTVGGRIGHRKFMFCRLIAIVKSERCTGENVNNRIAARILDPVTVQTEVDLAFRNIPCV